MKQRWRWWTDNNMAVTWTWRRSKISQFVVAATSVYRRSFLALPGRNLISNALSRPVPAPVPASRQWDTPREREREREIFSLPNRQFTVKLLGEAWRILRGVQQVVGCNKLLPATSGFATRAARVASSRVFLRLFSTWLSSLATRDSPIHRRTDFYLLPERGKSSEQRLGCKRWKKLQGDNRFFD